MQNISKRVQVNAGAVALEQHGAMGPRAQPATALAPLEVVRDAQHFVQARSAQIATTASELFERLAEESGRSRSRGSNGYARASAPWFLEFVQKILESSADIGECGGRVLRLKPSFDLDTTCLEIDMVLEALKVNHRVQALYIHNFENVRYLNSTLNRFCIFFELHWRG
jgi:hypothetical protein